MLFEEGNNLLFQVFQASYPIGHPLAMIAANHPTPEEVLKGMK